MKRKVSGNYDFSEGYHLLAIVSTLKDYSLAYFINKRLEIHLKKYADLNISEKGPGYPWFYYRQGNKYLSCFLIGNNHPGQKLLPALKTYDYFFLVKNPIDRNQLSTMAAGLRKIKNVLGVFEQDMTSIKGLELLMECNELHELQQIIIPGKQSKNIF